MSNDGTDAHAWKQMDESLTDGEKTGRAEGDCAESAGGGQTRQQRFTMSKRREISVLTHHFHEV